MIKGLKCSMVGWYLKFLFIYFELLIQNQKLLLIFMCAGFVEDMVEVNK